MVPTITTTIQEDTASTSKVSNTEHHSKCKVSSRSAIEGIVSESRHGLTTGKKKNTFGGKNKANPEDGLITGEGKQGMMRYPIAVADVLTPYRFGYK